MSEEKFVWVLEWGEGLNNYYRRFKLFSSEEAAERYKIKRGFHFEACEKRVND